jgi:hypothetical protein
MRITFMPLHIIFHTLRRPCITIRMGLHHRIIITILLHLLCSHLLLVDRQRPRRRKQSLPRLQRQTTLHSRPLTEAAKLPPRPTNSSSRNLCNHRPFCRRMVTAAAALRLEEEQLPRPTTERLVRRPQRDTTRRRILLARTVGILVCPIIMPIPECLHRRLQHTIRMRHRRTDLPKEPHRRRRGARVGRRPRHHRPRLQHRRGCHRRHHHPVTCGRRRRLILAIRTPITLPTVDRYRHRMVGIPPGQLPRRPCCCHKQERQPTSMCPLPHARRQAE